MTDKTSPRDQAVKMRTFLNEYKYATGRDNPFIGSMLPGFPPRPTVCMHTEQLIRFRNGYLLLMEFAALMCNRPIDELCPFDLMAPFLQLLKDEAGDD